MASRAAVGEVVGDRRRKAKKAERARRDARVVRKIQREAKKHGATLAHGGKGGLPPKTALAIFKRENWTCAVPNCKTAKEDLDLDHIGGHPLEIADDPDADAFIRRAAKMKHEDSVLNLHCVCARHHDIFHERERALEDGKKPKPVPE